MTTRFPTRLFLFAFLGWTFDFYDLVLLGFLKHAVGQDLHLTEQGESWMLGVALGASGVGGIAAGALADRFGKRTLLAATIAIYSLGTLLCGVAPSYEVFLLGRAITGLGVGGEWAIGHGMVAEAVPAGLRGRSAAALQAGEPFGAALAALAGYLLMPLVGWRWVMIGSSMTGLLALWARRSLHLPNEKSARRPVFAELRAARVERRMAAAWVLGVLKLGTYWTCYTWLPTFLLRDMGQGIGRSLAWVLTAQMGQFTGMLTFGWFSDRAGRRPAFCLYSLLTACGIFPLAFYWPWLATHPGGFWSAMLALGFGSGCTAGFGALLAELFPTEVRSTAMGTTYNMARAAQLGAPVLVGWAVAQHGLSGGLSVPLCLALAMALWVWLLPETRGIALPTLAAAAVVRDEAVDVEAR